MVDQFIHILRAYENKFNTSLSVEYMAACTKAEANNHPTPEYFIRRCLQNAGLDHLRRSVFLYERTDGFQVDRSPAPPHIEVDFYDWLDKFDSLAKQVIRLRLEGYLYKDIEQLLKINVDKIAEILWKVEEELLSLR